MQLKKTNIINLAIIGILLIALGFTTTLAVRYWNDIARLGNITITLGTDEGVEIDVAKVSPTFKGMLVPEGQAYFEGETDLVELEYTVNINKDLIQTMNLVIEALDITIGGSNKYAHLVEVTIDDEVNKKVVDFFNEIVTVNIVIRLLEPVDMNEAALTGKEANVLDGELAFQEIKGKQIGITLRFKVEPKN